jgi:hypothetical protein
MIKRRNNNAYYPCSICGWNSPLNEVKTDSKGVSTAYCPIHKQNDEDDRQGAVAAKNRDKAHDWMQKVVFDVNKTEAGGINV